MKKHLPQLDGLRGIAVLIVLLGHVAVFAVGLGISRLGPLPPLGVDLFFVLSGFLITNVLLEAQNAQHYYLNFYARRALRIWPLYTILLVCIFGIANRRNAYLTFDDAKIRWQYFALFVQNIVYPKPALLGPLALAVTWSVAVEEQFYFIWPVLVRSLPRKRLGWILLVPVIAAPIARYWLPALGVDPYINPLCRFDGMAIGGLAALWIFIRRPTDAVLNRAALWIMLVAVAGIAGASTFRLEKLLGKTFISAAFCGLLIAALSSKPVISILSRAWLRYIGKISYGIYLIHLPTAALIAALLPGDQWPARAGRACIILIATVVLATISWYLVESPILRLKRFFAIAEPQAPARSKTAPTLAMDDSVRQTA